MILYWAASCSVAAMAFLACRRWPRFALFILPLSVAFPWALGVSESPHGPRFPGAQIEHILGACFLVLVANLAGMQLGGFKVVFFTLFPGRGNGEREEDQ